MTEAYVGKGLFWNQEVSRSSSCFQLHAHQTVSSLTATHSGSSGVCPDSTTHQGTCNNGRSSCVNGSCSGSVCLANGLDDCQCTGNQACHVCCMVNGACRSTFDNIMVKLCSYFSLSSSSSSFLHSSPPPLTFPTGRSGSSSHHFCLSIALYASDSSFTKQDSHTKTV